jgi:hypothetical protein
MKTEAKSQEIVAGTKVIKDGYAGTVTEVCEWDRELVIVRLARGTTCVGKSTFDGRYENNNVVSY